MNERHRYLFGPEITDKDDSLSDTLHTTGVVNIYEGLVTWQFRPLSSSDASLQIVNEEESIPSYTPGSTLDGKISSYSHIWAALLQLDNPEYSKCDHWLSLSESDLDLHIKPENESMDFEMPRINRSTGILGILETMHPEKISNFNELVLSSLDSAFKLYDRSCSLSNSSWHIKPEDESIGALIESMGGSATPKISVLSSLDSAFELYDRSCSLSNSSVRIKHEDEAMEFEIPRVNRLVLGTMNPGKVSGLNELVLSSLDSAFERYDRSCSLSDPSVHIVRGTLDVDGVQNLNRSYSRLARELLIEQDEAILMGIFCKRATGYLEDTSIWKSDYDHSCSLSDPSVDFRCEDEIFYLTSNHFYEIERRQCVISEQVFDQLRSSSILWEEEIRKTMSVSNQLQIPKSLTMKLTQQQTTVADFKVLDMQRINSLTSDGEKEELSKIADELRGLRYRNQLSRQKVAEVLDIELEIIIAIENGFGDIAMGRVLLRKALKKFR